MSIPNTKPFNRRWVWLTAFTLIAVTALWFSGMLSGDASATRYRTAEVERGDVRIVVAATGTLAAVSTVDVGTQVSGQLVELAADFNSRVRTGDVIARIDPRPFEARVIQARADLSSAEAQLVSARAQRVDASVTLDSAHRSRQRADEVRAKGLISISDQDAAVLAEDQARARLQVADAAIRVAAASVEQRRAALTNVEFDLERAVIRSPVDGVVISRAVEKGQTVAASLQTPLLFSIAEDLSKMQIVLAIDEADIGQVRAGQSVTFNVDAFAQRRFLGSVREVRLSATDTQNVITYPVVVEVDNDDLSLLPGMTASAEIEISLRDDVVRIPNSALRFQPPQPVSGGFGGGPRSGGSATRAANGETGGRGASAVDELTARLSLTPEQQLALSSVMQTARQQAMSSASEGSDRGALMRTATSQALTGFRDQLTQDQQSALDQWMLERSSQLTGTVYLSGSDGLQPRRIRIGSSDGRFTELLDGSLKPGDKLVVGLAVPTS